MKNLLIILSIIFPDLITDKPLVDSYNSDTGCLVVKNFQVSNSSSTSKTQQNFYLQVKMLIADCCKEIGEFVIGDVLLDVNEPNNKTEFRTFSHEQDEFNYSMIAHKKLSIFEYSRVENQISIQLKNIPAGDHCLRILFLNGCKHDKVEDFNFTLP